MVKGYDTFLPKQPFGRETRSKVVRRRPGFESRFAQILQEMLFAFCSTTGHGLRTQWIGMHHLALCVRPAQASSLA